MRWSCHALSNDFVFIHLYIERHPRVHGFSGRGECEELKDKHYYAKIPVRMGKAEDLRYRTERAATALGGARQQRHREIIPTA